MIEKIPLIIDTDIGDDIDDVFALLLAMNSPEIELLGVTTVFGNTRLRAMIAQRLLRMGGYAHVPVYAGASVPLSNPVMFDRKLDFDAPPLTYLDKYAEPLRNDMDAAAFIISVLEKSSIPVTIVTLGALTNIAEVLRRRGDLKDRIRCLHIMGGAYSINWTEYNFACDPEAAAMVLTSGLLIWAVGVDVTLTCPLTPQHLAPLYAHRHPCLVMAMEMCDRWRQSGHVYLHDPMALWTVFDPDIIEFVPNVYQVETRGRWTRGICVNLSDHNWKVPSQNSKLHIARKVNIERFVQPCLDRITAFPQDQAAE
ncbi:MAG: nucleoside hydrolase [Caldicoprobacterales bacterium]|jgi:purine nucleosidase